ncbi:unnamed protein product [Sphacelaria rigidula]
MACAHIISTMATGPRFLSLFLLLQVSESFVGSLSPRDSIRFRCPSATVTGVRAPRVRQAHMAMETVEPLVTLLLSADSALSISELGSLGDQAPDVVGAASDAVEAAADLAGSAQSSVNEALGSVSSSMGVASNFFGSIVEGVTSAKDQVADTTLGSVDALKSQAGDLGASAIAPFKQFGGGLSQGVLEGIDSLKSGAQNAIEGAQTQLGESVTETIGNPLQVRYAVQESITSIFSDILGKSPEQVLKEEQSLTSGIQETIKGVEAVATPSTLFYAENAAILPLWLGMIIWPEKPITKAVMSSYATVIVAALLYVWLTYEALQNPVSQEAFASGITNLGALTKGFGEEVSVSAAWAHFLAQDLFIGRWVYLDGQKNGIFTKHSLALCYLFGPIGVLSHLLTRTLFSVVKPGVEDIMKPDKAASKTSNAGASAEARRMISAAKKEAEAIVAEARRDGAAQASSLLQSAETEALDILKGAEVERSALLKSSKAESVGDAAAKKEESKEVSTEPVPSSPLPSSDVASTP